jgi:predicted dehydrogenase
MKRRTFIKAVGLSTLAASGAGATFKGQQGNYRVAVIGHTGRGNYGHGLDRVWLDIPGSDIIAVADANPNGLSKAISRLGGVKGFPNYRQMLDESQPDLVSIATRWLDQHRDMVIASAERGVKGIYLEKPMCRTLEEADEMITACEKNNVKLAIAHQTRYSPKIKVIQQLISSGNLGQLLEFRARGKDDHRGGGEDLWVLGTHVLDIMRIFGGEPLLCSASLLQDARPVEAGDVKEGAEGIGPLAGDEVHVRYQLSGGAVGYFDSVRDGKGTPSRFGIKIFGTEGVIELQEVGYLPKVQYLPDSSWSPGRTGKKWIPISSAGMNMAEPIIEGGLHTGNIAAVKDLIAAIEEDRQPVSSIYEARKTTEMIVAAFESHRHKGQVTFPLKNRENPLTMLE